MKCEHCGLKDAAVYVRSNINGRVSEQRLCADCARALGFEKRLQPLFAEEMLHPFGMMEPLLRSFGSRLLSEFPAPAEETESGARLPKEEPLLPAQEQERLPKERERNALRVQLDEALDEEDYERAATLRDELRRLGG